MKTLHITSLIAIALIVFASSCSDPSNEILPNGNNEIENRGPGNADIPNDPENNGTDDSNNDENQGNDNGNNENSGNEGDNHGNSDKEKGQTGCGIRISSSDLPGGLAEYITRTYSSKAPYYHISRVEVCMENGKITTYTVTLNGPHSLTLNFNADGSSIN